MVTRLLTMFGFRGQAAEKARNIMVTDGYAFFYERKKLSGVSRVSRKRTIFAIHSAVTGQNPTLDSNRLVESAAFSSAKSRESLVEVNPMGCA